MEFIHINPEMDLSAVVNVLNVAHGTIAKEFGFTKETNPTNNAFVDEPTLQTQLKKGVDLYAISNQGKLIGCIAIEKSKREPDAYYIEKVSVIPEFRNQGHGLQLMNFAISRTKELGAKMICIALIDSNTKLKNWYASQGFAETGFKDFEHLLFRVCFMNKII